MPTEKLARGIHAIAVISLSQKSKKSAWKGYCSNTSTTTVVKTREQRLPGEKKNRKEDQNKDRGFECEIAALQKAGCTRIPAKTAFRKSDTGTRYSNDSRLNCQARTYFTSKELFLPCGVESSGSPLSLPNQRSSRMYFGSGMRALISCTFLPSK